MSPDGDGLDAQTVADTVAQIEAALIAAADLEPVEPTPASDPGADLGRRRVRTLAWVFAAWLAVALVAAVAYWAR